jgi:hypothetical protein
MTAHVLPFPRARHRTFVRRHAAHVAAMGRNAGERYLANQLKVQRETMTRRGIAPELIERECRSLEAAIRVALWWIVMREPEGAA